MPIDLTSGIVQILRDDNVTVGTGFLVSESGLIVTCAHVVQAAKVGPGDKLTVCFQKNGVKSNVLVIPGWWRSPGNEDIAILRLESKIPEGVKVLPLGSSEGIESHKIKTFGFPPNLGSIHGLWGKGTLYGKVPDRENTLLQIDSKEITSGFSGAPLWDKSRNRVIGVIVSIARKDSFDKLQNTAFAIPSETLRLICPELEIKDICPYRGLLSFTEEDQEFFFGRDKLVQELMDKLSLNPRFLAVVGSSGKGKSSVVSAGLLPKIQQGEIAGFEDAIIVTLRPGIKPNESLKKALSSVLHVKERDFWDRASFYLQKEGDKRLVVFVDQFEELFTISDDDEINEFIENLINFLENRLDVSLILTIRADFYEFLINSKFEKYLRKGQINVTSMSEKELKDAIKKPAAAVGLKIETGLEDSLIKDLKNTEDPLPLLEFTLTKLWEQRSDGQLTYKRYRKLGGVTGAIGQWADEAYEKLSDEEKELSRNIFTRLIHYGDSGTRDSRRRLSLAELTTESEDKETIHKLITKLADAHLLVTDRKPITETETVEIIHDSLIPKWDRLNEWIEEHRNFLLWRQRLDTKINEWNTGEDEGSLLHGAVLGEAKEWKEKREQELNESEKKYIQKSLETREKENRKRKLLIQGLSIFSILTLLLAGFAVHQSVLAKEQKEESLARYLASKSEDLGENSMTLDTSALLAIESFRLHRTADADRLIHNLLPLRCCVASLEHFSDVSSFTFSPDGKYIATASFDSTARLWNATTGKQIFVLNHNDVVEDVVFSPDGKYIATASFDSTARLWNATTGKQIFVLNNKDFVMGVEFSPDGKYIATASGDNTARLWNATTGKQIFVLNNSSSVVFSPDGKYIATASFENTARLWNATTGKQIFVLNNSSSVVFSPDGKYIATASDVFLAADDNTSFENTARLWNATTGKEIFVLSESSSVVFSPDGKYIATVSDEGAARLWNATTGKKIFVLSDSSWIFNIIFSSDGKYIATAGGDNTKVWDTTTGEELFALNINDWQECIEFSPNGKYIATTSDSKIVSVWQVEVEKKEAFTLNNGELVNSIIFSPDGKYIATASGDNTARSWNATTGEEIFVLNNSSSVVFSPDGKYIATANDGRIAIESEDNTTGFDNTSFDNTARLWNATTGKEIFILNNSSSVEFSPDGKYIATASFDNTARLRKATTGKEIFVLNNSSSIEFSPDGKCIATVSDDGTARLWNATTGREIFVLNNSSSIEFSPDGKYIATASGDNTSKLWNATTGKQIFVFNDSSSVVFSPDGKYVATASDINRSKVWEISTGKVIFTLSNSDSVYNIVFSPNGTYIATAGTASFDNAVKVWDATTGELIFQRNYSNYITSLAFSPDEKYILMLVDYDAARLLDVFTGDDIFDMGLGYVVHYTAFSPDGKYIVTAGDGYGTAEVWMYRTDDIINKVGAILTRNLTPEEWKRYMGDEPYHKTFPNLP